MQTLITVSRYPDLAHYFGFGGEVSIPDLSQDTQTFNKGRYSSLFKIVCFSD